MTDLNNKNLTQHDIDLLKTKAIEGMFFRIFIPINIESY